MKGLKQKKAHLMEIQVNGGTIADKVDYGYKVFLGGAGGCRLSEG